MRFPVDIHFLSVVDPWVDISRKGIDIGMPCGTPVVSMACGRVIYSGEASQWSDTSSDHEKRGFLVIVRFDEPVLVDGIGYRFGWYENLRSAEKEVARGALGPEVVAGGRLGCSGTAEGCSFINLRLLTERNGVTAKDLSKQRLGQLIWGEIAGVSLDDRGQRRSLKAT